MKNAPRMTEAHFELIANVIARHDFDKYTDVPYSQRLSLAYAFAAVLSLTNTDFRKEAFINAATKPQ